MQMINKVVEQKNTICIDMHKVIDIELAKKERLANPNAKVSDVKLKVRCIEFAEEILHYFSQTTKFATNLYFTNSLPDEVKNDFKVKRLTFMSNAIDDLNVLSLIEQKIGLNAAILSPGNTEVNSTGYFSVFTISKCFLSSPELETENLARAFSILLFLRAKEYLKEAAAQ